MKLSRDEDLFLRHWIYDEAHYLDGVGPAKRLQVERRVAPVELAAIIAASIPDPEDQKKAATTRPASVPSWPWSAETFRNRVAEAHAALGAQL